MPLPGDRRRRRTSILSPIACPPPSTVTTMTNITLGAQCIGFYECPLRKRRKTRRWRIAVERHERAWKEEAGGKQWRALRFYYVILLMQRARRKERGGPRARARLECPATKNIMSLGQKTSHEIFLCPPRSAMPSPGLAEFHLCAFLTEVLRVASNNAKRHIMEYVTDKDVWQNRQYNRKLV